MKKVLLFLAVMPIFYACSKISLEDCVELATVSCDGDTVCLYIGDDTIHYPKTFDMHKAFFADSIVEEWHNQVCDTVRDSDFEIARRLVKYVYSGDTIPELIDTCERFAKVEDIDFDGRKEIMISGSEYSHFHIYKIIDGRLKLMIEEPYDQICRSFSEWGEGDLYGSTCKIDADSMIISINNDLGPYPYIDGLYIYTKAKYIYDANGKYVVDKYYYVENGDKTQIYIKDSTCKAVIVYKYKLKDINGLLNVTLTYEGSVDSPILENINLNKIKDLSL